MALEWSYLRNVILPNRKAMIQEHNVAEADIKNKEIFIQCDNIKPHHNPVALELLDANSA